MVMRVIDIVPAADTTEQGQAFFIAVSNVLNRHDEAITLSFEGISTMTSSFANSGLVPLLDTMSFAEIKRRLVVRQSTRQINDMIRSRLEREAIKNAEAA